MAEILAAICDDEKMATDIISSAVITCFHNYDVELKIDKFNSPAELEKAVETGGKSYNILFLDIDMPRMDGITLGKRLRPLIKDGAIIFVSNREDRVFDTFAVQPFGFIRKSKFLQDLETVVNHFVADLGDAEGKNSCINFKTSKGMVRVSIRKILYIGCVKDYQYVYVDGEAEPIKVKLRMGMLEESLVKYGFIRIHQGYILNYRYIKKIEADSVELTDGQMLPLSRRKKQEVMMQYMRLSSS